MNKLFTDVLRMQATLHPSFTPQDALKLSFQAAFGAEHLLSDPIGAQQYFEAEFHAAQPTDFPDEALVEQISPNFCRVNLRGWKRLGLPPLWLFRLFLESTQTGADLIGTQADSAPAQQTNATAKQMQAGTNTVQPPIDAAIKQASDCPNDAIAPCFAQKLADIRALTVAGQLPFGLLEWEGAQSVYLADGVRAVHHSNAYRTAEQPSYRLISTRFLPLLPLLERLAALPAPAKGAAHIIAIDGRCGGGKSTLATALCRVLQTEAMISMDDFFLPPALRTPDRLATPGGNIEHERFAAEVLPHLGKSESFAYQQFSCAKMALCDTKEIGKSCWHVVEGSYSHHPALGDYATLRAFVDIAPDAQITRIRARNGAAWAEDFVQKWIPMEERYFATCHTHENADIILNTSPV